MNPRSALFPVILSGGVGSRLWPVSRELHPKPFIRLANGKSLLQETFLRAGNLPHVHEILTVTNQELFFSTREAFEEVNSQNLSLSFILEPFGRNTAAAIAAASLQVAQKNGENALLLILPADHLITNQSVFAEAVTKASTIARDGKLVLFGIQPPLPETGYGYIETDGKQVIRFIEKPNLEKAQEYVASGQFYWNSGMFCFRAGTMLREMETHCPEILQATRTCLERSVAAPADNASKIELNTDFFEFVPDQSIDYAVMEKSHNVALVPCTAMGWSDVGSWNALGNLISPDSHGNCIDGEVELHDVRNCYIRTEGRLIAAVGLTDLIIIDTPDALLIADNRKSQEVRQIYATLKAKGHATHKIHQTAYRPWGSYTVLGEGPQFKIKKIVVKPGGRLSLQMHHHRSEHWTVVSGKALVTNDAQEFFLEVNGSTYIPAGCKHRLENTGTVDLVLIEVQSGPYLGEDDIVRFDDVYGRNFCHLLPEAG